MKDEQFIFERFGFLGNDFLEEIQKHSSKIKIKGKTEILAEGNKIKNIPFVITGSLKVYALNDGRELIYNYIRSGETCLMSFSTIFNDFVSRVYVVSEEDTEALLIPATILLDWLIKYPHINKLFYYEFDLRFTDIMKMVNDAVFHKLDKRVLNYIKQQIIITGNNPIKLTHKEIANNLGTSREVVSRVLKKVENEGEITQTKEGIKMLVSENVRLS
ncbi:MULTISPECIES: Crp/Fnr family transcriptional regulator [Chryseobacterium]|uniref:Crp/Fnr family transcriptional regulator n=1 Tax=Chryseobacterium TaxID=59732 RepID=UPI000C9E4850|nr:MULTISPECIES: Crp/Fnr family transcriptional regulator [Chryseobacterium]VXA99640.1 CRP/FNR family transcriptional regulator, anaerobic regulatory protein [Chryseobacterium sp. 8AT]